MSINRVNISGNLTRDPELRSTAGGTQILSFGVAVNDRRRNAQTGEWEDVPNFIDCVVFGQRASSPRVRRLPLKANFAIALGRQEKVSVAVSLKLLLMRLSFFQEISRTAELLRRPLQSQPLVQHQMLQAILHRLHALPLQPRRHQSHRRPMSMTRIFRFNQRIFSYEGSKKGI